MCGRYTIGKQRLDRLEAGLQTDLGTISTRYNAAPSQPLPVITQDGGSCQLVTMYWGLVPHWSKEPRPQYSTINAKVETAAKSPAYRAAYKARRCLVPATGWYEWRKAGDHKQPYYIHQGGQDFAFAGLREYWEGQGADPFQSYTIITGPAADSVKDIHARMPLVLPADVWSTWLAPGTGAGALSDILSAPEEIFEVYPVSTRVNSPRNEGAELITPQQ